MKQLNKLLSAFSTKTLMLLSFFALLPTMASAQCPDNNHPHMIDLGLPSGTKWACCNVGASKPEDYGGYYAWGEIEEKDVYDWSTYIHCDGSEDTSHDIGKDIAGTQYDAATANWGSPWVMPSKEQMEELKNNCTSEWTTENGVNGRRFTGPNGASIFLSATGDRWGVDLNDAGSSGYCWSSSLLESDTNYSWYLYFGSGNVYTHYYGGRFIGLSVRPVVAGSSTPSGNIDFADPAVKALCVANWDTNGDGELGYNEAAAITDLGDVFLDNKEITRFDELQYFTGLTSIGNAAFSRCTGLTSVTIPNSVTVINNYAFDSCSGLTSIVIPNSVTEIWTAFRDCSGLVSVTIGNSVRRILNSAFTGCSNLKSIIIPESVSDFGFGVFSRCTNLTSITVEANNSVYDSRNNCNAIIETATNTLIAGCKTTVIPNGVTRLLSRAFSGCEGLVSVDIPKSVESIDNQVFEGCSNLTSIKVDDDNNFYKSEDGVLFNKDMTAILLYPMGKTETSYTIPNKVTSIEYGAFYYCFNLTSIIIPESVTIIGDYAFYGCNNLTTLNIPNNLTTIGRDAFFCCSGITSLTIPSSVTDIGYAAFWGYKNMQLKVVKSFIQEPFTIDNSVFEIAYWDDKYPATLYVPAGTKEKYEATAGWNKFQNIVEMGASSGIAIDATNFPDENFRNWVLEQDYGLDGVLTEAEIDGVTEIDIDSQNIADLKGLEYFTALTQLWCDYNELNSLDVSKNTALTRLCCAGNQLTSLDLSQNTALITLYCYENQINETEMGKLVESLPANNGELLVKRLDISNEQNVITTEQVAAAKAKGWYVLALDGNVGEWGEWVEYDGDASAGIPINSTTFPDENFRNWVLAQDYGQDGVLTEEEIAGVTSIDVSDKNIADLKGIEYFTELKFLNCYDNQLISLDVSMNTALIMLNCFGNQLTSLDVSMNMALIQLSCSNNQLTSLDLSRNTTLATLGCGNNKLTSLDISQNTALTSLSCDYTQLTSLDVSHNTALIELTCYGNQLTTLDVSQNTALEFLQCGNNQLTMLDVTKNISLTRLYCHYNQLTSLDVSKNTALTMLLCHNNQLTSLDFSRNTVLEYLDCYCNNIKGAAMDALIASLPGKGGSFYAISPSDEVEQNVVTKAQVAAAKEKGWKTYYYSYETWNWEEYEGSEQEMDPISNGETIDIGNEIDENTSLDGNVVGDVYYSISSGDGNYDAAEGCLVVTKPTDDSAIDGQDIFGDDFKENYTGIVFKVNEGKGSIKVEAETQGNMVLKVKIGNSDPIEMELDGKLKVKFPYDVSEETLVYIYGGMGAAGAKAMGANRAKSAADLLKIYGFEIVSDPSGIDAIENGNQPDAPVYNLNGQRVNTPGKGIYIKNGRKVLMK